MSMTNGLPKTIKIVVWTLVGLLGVSLTLYESSSLKAWYVARQLGRHFPNLSLTPIPLPDSRVAESTDRESSGRGFRCSPRGK